MEENKNINEQEEKIFKDNKEEANVVGRQGVYNPGQFYFPLPITSKEDTVNNINTSRVTFYNQVATSDKTRKILLFSFLGIFLLIAVLLLINPVLVNNLFTPLIVIFVVFLLVTYFITSSNKRKRNMFMDEYRYHYFINIDSYCYYQVGFSNIELSYNTKIDLEEVQKIGCYENITSCPSRDMVKGTMFGVKFTSFDALIKTKIAMDEKSVEKIVFSGKLFSFDLQSKKAGKMFIYLKGCGDSFPTELKGMEEVDIKDLKKEYKVFSSYANPNQILNKKCIDTLNKFNIDDVVEDIIITISNQGTFFGLSLTSEYMTIPYQNDVNDKFLLHYKKNLENIAMFVAALSANHKISSEE